jgi:hypothetical protein
MKTLVITSLLLTCIIGCDTRSEQINVYEPNEVTIPVFPFSGEYHADEYDINTWAKPKLYVDGVGRYICTEHGVLHDPNNNFELHVTPYTLSVHETTYCYLCVWEAVESILSERITGLRE